MDPSDNRTFITAVRAHGLGPLGYTERISELDGSSNTAKVNTDSLPTPIFVGQAGSRLTLHDVRIDFNALSELVKPAARDFRHGVNVMSQVSSDLGYLTNR